MTPKPSPQDQLKQHAKHIVEFCDHHYNNVPLQEYMREILHKSDPVFYNKIDLAIITLSDAAAKFMKNTYDAKSTSEIFRRHLPLLAYVTYAMDIEPMSSIPSALLQTASDFLHEKPIVRSGECDFGKVQRFIARCGMEKVLNHIKPGPLFDITANASAFCDTADRMQARRR